ncbi:MULTISPECIES: hypothetical protein [unclassified Sulfitobacter]|uniref:hypothetical protein n=1 Tax=unclassified Sulfitobacter TaxID=196795 RepID=UPI0007C2E086|nr:MULTISPECIES: hypothetical protein [unclassified Sulfitobacter]KZX99913.1 hypothetical protein A3720_11790 [Sulfitobacter sp. HI0021]KZY00170.1 hypothetical protein A3722_11460 [Sulfitobacter sp. HI0027]KZZ00416.1 hypothetical protein A3747_05290 [Sulfitobacter sp. HI0076]
MALNIENRDGFAELWDANTKALLMAQIYSCTKGRIYHWAVKHDLRPRDPKGRVIQIDRDEFAALWAGQKPTRQIASELRCTERAVLRLADYFELGSRDIRAAAKAVELTPRTVPGASFWTHERDELIRASGGRYSAIADLSKELGIAAPKIMARWHRLRVKA